jgi:hypothetical protein
MTRHDYAKHALENSDTSGHEYNQSHPKTGYIAALSSSDSLRKTIINFSACCYNGGSQKSEKANDEPYNLNGSVNACSDQPLAHHIESQGSSAGPNHA